MKSVNNSPTEIRNRLIDALFHVTCIGTINSREPFFRLVASGRFPLERYNLKDLKSDHIKNDNWHLRKLL